MNLHFSHAMTRLQPWTIVLPLLVVSSCTTDFRELDELQVRRQFHVPEEVRLDTLVSNPATPGWFGREGLRIRAVFQFTGAQYERYEHRLSDPRLWRAVRFLHYAPDGVEWSAPGSLQWQLLPLAPLPPALAHLHGLFDSAISRGYWYCNLVIYRRGDSIPHPGGGYHFQWHAHGVHGTALPADHSPIITTFGILDARRKRLYAWIGFSG